VLEAIRSTVRYFTFDNIYYSFFIMAVYALFLAKLYFMLLLSMIRKVKGESVGPVAPLPVMIKNVLVPLRVVAPFALIILSITPLTTNMSYALRFAGKDLWLWAGDAALFGVPPFLSLAHALADMPLFVYVLKHSYEGLTLVMNVGILILFILSAKQLFRLVTLAFAISVLISLPFFYALPCQDPYNYFIKNVRGNELSQEKIETINRYTTSASVESVRREISAAETAIPLDNAVPVSCFPSMHAEWSLICIYYLARLRRYTLFLSIPWILLLLVGGVVFGQHYVVDYLFGAVLAIVSIWGAKKLFEFGGGER
jgi:membrane-associated phospholipid phosphatase